MPPRKSLAGQSATSTPNASSSRIKRTRTRDEVSLSSSPIKPKRGRRGVKSPTPGEETLAVTGVVKLGESSAAPEEVEGDPDAELEAWQDFAADHYEMVEQLPLELHRNFRLLRELDEGNIIQTEKLYNLIRKYITERLPVDTVTTPDRIGDVTAALDVMPDQALPGGGAGDKYDTVVTGLRPKTDDSDGLSIPEELGVPVPDGEGGLILPPLNDAKESDEATTEGRFEFPPSTIAVYAEGSSEVAVIAEPTSAHTVSDANGELSSIPTSGLSSIGVDSVPVAKVTRPVDGPYKLLSEISRLAREIVRTGEEKVGVAVGAYNAIDRHIRALDSALTAQEASILLGLRPSTLPSTAVDTSLNLAGDTAALPGAAGEIVASAAAAGGDGTNGVTLGLGGGGGGRRNKKGRNGRKKDKEEEVGEAVVLSGLVDDSWSIPADPNEPIYCYCKRVAYGQMIGCDNDDCPIDWYHLDCAGLTEPPKGKWLCNLCRPKGGLGKAGPSAHGTPVAVAGAAGKSEKGLGSGRKKR